MCSADHVAKSQSAAFSQPHLISLEVRIVEGADGREERGSASRLPPPISSLFGLRTIHFPGSCQKKALSATSRATGPGASLLDPNRLIPVHQLTCRGAKKRSREKPESERKSELQKENIKVNLLARS